MPKEIKIKKLIPVFLGLLLVSCNNPSLVKTICSGRYEKIDLGKFGPNQFDKVLIVNMGDHDLRSLNLDSANYKSWLGEKILFCADNKISKQINLPYYVSEPVSDYVSFFNDAKEEYLLFDKGDLLFQIKKYNIGKQHSLFVLNKIPLEDQSAELF